LSASIKKSRGRPRTKPAEQRRDDLLEAAQRLFLDQGFIPTTIDQIAAAAGVAKGTVYLYFASKDEIRGALGERFARKHLAFMQKAVADAPERPLEAWAEASVAFYLEALKLHDMLFFEANIVTREGLVDNLAIDHLTELLASGTEEPRALAVFLFSGIHAVIDDAVTKENPVDRDRLTARVKALLAKVTGESPAPRPQRKRAEPRQGTLF
jgi:AcrR family transcriptional regulator